jgi:hypothetical protein
MMTDILTVLAVIITPLEMINLDYYDQRTDKECYCEDTLFAFGSEDYLSQRVQSSEYTETEMSCASIIMMLRECAAV